MSNTIKVLLFATLRTAVGQKEVSIEISSPASVLDVKHKLLSLYPSLTLAMNSALVSINREFACDDDIVPDGAEIALFPPVSGGMTEEYPIICRIAHEEININQIISDLASRTTGAIVLFTGLVRGITKKNMVHEVDYLEYDAYFSMAMDKMRNICDDIRTKWTAVEGIALVQRVGVVKPGEVSVVVACSSSHRDSGVFEAAHYGIDRLKEIVPIWKKEVGPSGEVWIEGSYIPKAGE